MPLTAAEVFRDYEIDGNPSSGAHKPIKAEIRALLAGLNFQVIQTSAVASDTIDDDTTVAIVNRSAPSTTARALPDASLRSGLPLSVIDYSQSVVDHTITLTPFQASQKVMRQSTWSLFSNASNLASVTLIPIVDPDDSGNYVWVIAP